MQNKYKIAKLEQDLIKYQNEIDKSMRRLNDSLLTNDEIDIEMELLKHNSYYLGETRQKLIFQLAQ